MKASILVMYGITPCHAGSGASVGVVDSPIQRERHTNWPLIQSSGMKGAMRMHFERNRSSIKDRSVIKDFDNLVQHVFGASSADKDRDYSGSLSVSDAKILAFPMRSNVAPFVWMTCPAVLKRLMRDLALAGKECDIDVAFGSKITPEKALVWSGNFSGRVLLEDVEVQAEAAIMPAVFSGYFGGAERLLVVDDSVFGYGVDNCTQIVAQISIDQKTGTTTGRSLRYQEELPADSILYSVVLWGDARDRESGHTAETIKNWCVNEVMPSYIQAGGDETLGRGYFGLKWI